MPIYTYLCDACKKNIEIEQKITDEPEVICPECGESQLHRIPPKDISFHFKGSGFYKTDYTSNTSKKEKDSSSGHGCGSGSCGCGS